MMMQQNILPFTLTQKQKWLLMWWRDINDIFESIYSTIISNIQKYLGKVSGWIIDSVVSHIINISDYNPLAGSSYIKWPKGLDHPRKVLINI